LILIEVRVEPDRVELYVITFAVKVLPVRVENRPAFTFRFVAERVEPTSVEFKVTPFMFSVEPVALIIDKDDVVNALVVKLSAIRVDTPRFLVFKVDVVILELASMVLMTILLPVNAPIEPVIKSMVLNEKVLLTTSVLTLRRLSVRLFVQFCFPFVLTVKTYPSGTNDPSG